VRAVVKRLSCHICQEACPFSIRFAEPAREPGYAARGPGERPVGVENVCVAIGNWLASAPPGEPLEGAVDALAAALSDPEPLVRGHAAWALAGGWGGDRELPTSDVPPARTL
jgi:epoxyqueuosine reductase QueG